MRELSTLDRDALAFADAIRPESSMLPSEWANRYRILPPGSVEPGKFSFDRTPYLREPIDSMHPNDPTQVGVLVKGSQIGGTEAINCLIGAIIHQWPAPILFVEPTEKLAQRLSKEKLAPMLNETPELRERVTPARSRDSGNTILSKEFPGGILLLVGANSPVGLRSATVRYLFLDEIDGYPPSAGVEGNPEDLAERRTANYGARKKIFKLSTPLVTSNPRIVAAFEQTDKREFRVPCPYCNFRAPILFRNLRSPGGAPWHRDELPEDVVLICESCSREIAEHHKSIMLAAGEWIPTAEGLPFHKGWRIPAFYAPIGWYSWKSAAHDFLKAGRDREKLKVWVNTVAAEPYQDEVEKAEALDLYQKRVPVSDRLPARILAVLAGIDVQNNRIELGIWGFTPNETIRPIDYTVLPGDPTISAVWNELERRLVDARYPHESGIDLPIMGAGLDSGFATQEAYSFALRRLPLALFVLKGAAGQNIPTIRPPISHEVEGAGRSIELFTIGVDGVKSWLYGRIANTIEGKLDDGGIEIESRLPFSLEWVTQLCAEQRTPAHEKGREVYRWGLRPGERRNEVLDSAVYARAAMLLLNPNWLAIAGNIARRAKGPTPDAEATARRARRRKNPWANRD